MSARVIIGNDVYTLAEFQPGIFIGLGEDSLDILFCPATGEVARFATTYSEEAREWIKANRQDSR